MHLAAVHMSHIGPSRHFAWAQQSGRFRREADISWQAEPADLVANDPKRALALNPLSRAR
jgi:hypothetical protein